MIVVVGGGIAGAFTAFALARAGASPILIERAGVAREASVRNPGGLNPLHGAGIPGPMQAFALESFRLNIDPWDELRTRSGINFHGRTVSRIHVVLDDKDRASLEPMKAIQDATPGFGARWLDRPELIAIEPRITPTALGALRVEGNARVDAQAYTRAVTAAAVSLGAKVVVDEVTGLESRGARVSGVVLGSGTIPCDGVVIASGVWTDAPAQWLGVTLPIETWKGELLIANIDGAPVVHTFSCRDGSVYGDGTNRVWIGGTEAQVGFDQTPTPEGRALLFERAQRFFPTIAEARVVSQVAGVRPVSADGLPIVGPAPGWDNAWLALGGGRKGILYGAGMGQAVAELATRGQTRL